MVNDTIQNIYADKKKRHKKYKILAGFRFVKLCVIGISLSFVGGAILNYIFGINTFFVVSVISSIFIMTYFYEMWKDIDRWDFEDYSEEKEIIDFINKASFFRYSYCDIAYDDYEKLNKFLTTYNHIFKKYYLGDKCRSCKN